MAINGIAGFTAKDNLEDSAFRFVGIDGDYQVIEAQYLANDNRILGVLQQGSAIDEPVDIAIDGSVSKVIADAAVHPGDRLKVGDYSGVTPHTSGALCIGMALEGAAADDVFNILVYHPKRID